MGNKSSKHAQDAAVVVADNKATCVGIIVEEEEEIEQKPTMTTYLNKEDNFFYHFGTLSSGGETRHIKLIPTCEMGMFVDKSVPNSVLFLYRLEHTGMSTHHIVTTTAIWKVKDVNATTLRDVTSASDLADMISGLCAGCGKANPSFSVYPANPYPINPWLSSTLGTTTQR